MRFASKTSSNRASMYETIITNSLDIDFECDPTEKQHCVRDVNENELNGVLGNDSAL